MHNHILSCTHLLIPPVSYRHRHPDQRYAAIKVLLHDLPIEHKPTLRYLAHMLWRACHHPAEDDASDIALQHPNHGRRGHLPHDFERTIMAPLSARTLAPILARSLLRPYVPPSPSKAAPPPDQPPEAAALVRALIDGYPSLFHDLREVEARKANALQEKVQRLAVLVEETRLPALTDVPECAPLFRRLFRFLARVERRINRASHVTASPKSSRHGMGDVSSPPRRRRVGSREGRPTRAKSSSPRLRSPSAAARVAVGESNGGGGGHHSEHEHVDSEEEDDEHFSFSSPRWEVRVGGSRRVRALRACRKPGHTPVDQPTDWGWALTRTHIHPDLWLHSRGPRGGARAVGQSRPQRHRAPLPALPGHRIGGHLPVRAPRAEGADRLLPRARRPGTHICDFIHHTRIPPPVSNHDLPQPTPR